MSRDDKQEWAGAYNKEYQGFKERNAFKVVRPSVNRGVPNLSNVLLNLSKFWDVVNLSKFI